MNPHAERHDGGGPWRWVAVNLEHFVRGRPRLLIGLALGLAVGLLLPGPMRSATRLLIGWNAGIWCYVLLAAVLMSRATSARVRATAEREDPSAVAVLALMSFAAMASLAAILFELAAARTLPEARRLPHYGLTASTLCGSWLFLNTIYTFHYARMYYRSNETCRPLRFPGEDAANPNFWDFLYFSFTIAAAAQTSDVSVMTRAMRKTVLGHTILGFFFNAAIIGTTINVAAGLIGS